MQPGLSEHAAIPAVLLAGLAAAALGHALTPAAALVPLVALSAVVVALAQQTLP